MAEHTHSPWVVERSQRCFLVVSKDELKDWPILVAMTGSDIDTDEANARLIAAAPELLRACLQARDALMFIEAKALPEFERGWNEEIDALELAIAKATAEESDNG